MLQIVVALSLGFIRTETVQAPPKQPNVVLILVDDLGWQDTSLAFGLNEKVVGRHFRTPNLEKLASRGIQVNQAYSSCTVCTPTRVALLTGTHPARNHITSWVQKGQDTESPYPGLTMPQWKTTGFQPGEAITFADHFRTAGYRTIQVGKAHFGSDATPGANPINLGFDVSIGGSAAGNPNSFYGLNNFASKKKSPNDPPSLNDIRGLEKYHGKDFFLDDALAIEAAKQIEISAQSGQPTFLWYSPYGVHTPIQPNKKYLKHYPKLDPREQAYATMVETVDDNLRVLVESFRKSNQLENTFFIFTSDNGGLSQSARGGYPNLHNLPLRSGKGSGYEGGTRVPFVVAGPGLPVGKVLSRITFTSADLFPTVAELAGIPKTCPDGISFAKILRSGTDVQRSEPLIWHFPHHRGWYGPGLEPYSAIRIGDFKAIFFYGTRKWELYNLANDLGETHDLAPTNASKLKELASILHDKLVGMQAQFPVDNQSLKQIEPNF